METTLAVVVTLLFILIIGWAAGLLVGRRLLNLFDSVVQSIPLVEKIYGATKQLLSVMQQKPDDVQRVVLINFPHDSMKAVGFVTRTLTDEDTGEKIAAVYVPTTPNPTSGYLELVPIHNVISTDWTVDQAMSFIISGGAVSEDTINFRRSRGDPIPLDDSIGKPPPIEPEKD
ncbi:MAG: DUF502 domain-containing protein [Alphaproteobacteria bacterium]